VLFDDARASAVDLDHRVGDVAAEVRVAGVGERLVSTALANLVVAGVILAGTWE
jgi:hypothetical protein